MALTKIKAAALTADLIDETKLADNSIDSEHYNDGSIDNAHLADDAVGVAELSATGTASSSTFLRGDNSWVTPTDTNTQLAFANDANNRVVTGDGSGGLNGEANLTFDGTYFQVQHATAAIARVQNSTAATSQSASIELAPANGLLGHTIKSVSEEDFSTGANRTAYLSIEGRKDGTLAERMRIHSSGAVTKPYHPSCSAYWNGASAVGGSGTRISSNDVAIANVERWDIGGNYNTSNGRYTAPVAGKYQVTFRSNLILSNLSVGNYFNISVYKNGSLLYYNYDLCTQANWQYMSFTNIVNMAANDYVDLRFSSNSNLTFGVDPDSHYSEVTFSLIQ